MWRDEAVRRGGRVGKDLLVVGGVVALVGLGMRMGWDCYCVG